MAFIAEVLEENCHQIGSMYLDIFDNSSDFDYACTNETWQTINGQLPDHEHAKGDYGKKEVYTIPDRWGDGKFQILVCNTDQDLAAVLADNKMVKDYLDNLPREILVKIKDLKNNGKEWTDDFWKSLDELNGGSSGYDKTVGPGTLWFKAMLKWLQVIDGINTDIAANGKGALTDLINGYNSIFEEYSVKETTKYHANFKQSLKDTFELLLSWEFTLAKRSGFNFTVHIDFINKRTRREERISYNVQTNTETNAIGEAMCIMRTCMWDVKKNEMSVDIVNIDCHLNNGSE